MHPNAILQRAWSKYGRESFQWVVVERDIAQSELLAREQFHLAPLLPNRRDELFNLRVVASNNLGVRHTPEARAKISAANQARGKPFCGRGHGFTTENTHYSGACGGRRKRSCRECRRIRTRAKRRRVTFMHTIRL